MKNFFTSLFKKRQIVFFDILDEYEINVRGADISNRNTLLGSVKSRQQYDVNVNHRFYHVPEYKVASPDKVEYVALYRSKNNFMSDSPGVIHYGKVISYVRIKRRDIKELNASYSPDDYYYRFEIDRWETLPHPLKARELAPKACEMTSHFLLKNCKFVNELYIRNNDEFKLYLGIMDVLSGAIDGIEIKDCKVFINRSAILICSEHGKRKFKIEDYKKNTIETLHKIYDFIFN